jgi:hypothetical protein
MTDGSSPSSAEACLSRARGAAAGESMRRYSWGVLGIVTALMVCTAMVASAQMAQVRTCVVENAQVSVSFSGIETDITSVRSKLDTKIAELKGLAEEQQFAKLVVQSSNYSISTNYTGGAAGDARYQFNGNISFVILPAQGAVDFMQMLIKKGYQANVNVNTYNNGSCP